MREVKDWAFNGCRGLKCVEFAPASKLELLGAGAFQGSGLRAFRAPERLREIGPYAFRMCGDLASVELGQNLEAFGAECFADSGLKEVEIPRGVVEVPEKAFHGCLRLKNVQYASGARCEVIGERAFAQSGVQCFRAPEGLRVLGSSAFERAFMLDRVELNDGLREVSESAFNACARLRVIYSAPGLAVQVGQENGNM